MPPGDVTFIVVPAVHATAGTRPQVATALVGMLPVTLLSQTGQGVKTPLTNTVISDTGIEIVPTFLTEIFVEVTSILSIVTLFAAELNTWFICCSVEFAARVVILPNQTKAKPIMEIVIRSRRITAITAETPFIESLV